MSEENVTPAASLGARAVGDIELPEELRADVRLLTSLLGRVLRESGSAGLYEDVEQLRQTMITAYSDETSASFEKAEEIVENFSVERADEVARAFTVYFHLVNLAEEFYRTRLLHQETGSDLTGTDTVAGAYSRLIEEIGESAARKRLSTMRFHPVFTAHPTEARRRAVSSSIRRLDDYLEERYANPSNPVYEHRMERRLLEEIDTLWRTAPVREHQPKPEDEVRSIMAVFDETLYTTVPKVYRRICDILQGDESGRTPPAIKPFLRLGTWVGGDRDGNPFVTASVTKKALAISSDHILRGLEVTADRVARTLTLSADTTPSSPELKARWHQLTTADEDGAASAITKAPDEPHKRVLMLVSRKIQATRTRNADLAYSAPEELISDLRLVQDSLARARANRQAYGDLQQLIWQVETFGFHLAELEVRQHSMVHARALAECEAGGELSTETEEVLEVFRTIAQLQGRYGVEASRRYIVSFTQSAADLENVYKLAHFAVGPGGKAPVLDVIPLFETYADLQASTAILSKIAKYPEYAERLQETDGDVEVMIGYSDSSKDVGPVAATLALYEAQANIAEWAVERGLKLTLFHGRGGSLGRGGGPTNTAILGQPPHSVGGRFKLTEQGEVIFARYGDPTIAMRHIDQVAAATLLAAAPSIEQRNLNASEQFADIARVMDRSSKERFLALVNAEGFAPWFATVTPMEEIGQLALGSRPARRGLSVESLADLRAIPWVFSWSQARLNLAGWYGLGTALQEVNDLNVLREAYEKWPLFTTMIDNVGMSIAKADSRIAERYLQLGDRPDFTEMVLDEMALTRRWITDITDTTGNGRIIDNRPELQLAVKMRSPYVDALSLLQLRALRVLRSQEPSPNDTDSQAPGSQMPTGQPRDGSTSGAQGAPEWQHLLLLSVSGVSAGLKNTG